jgi:hypothetical protein
LCPVGLAPLAASRNTLVVPAAFSAATCAATLWPPVGRPLDLSWLDELEEKTSTAGLPLFDWADHRPVVELACEPFGAFIDAEKRLPLK